MGIFGGAPKGPSAAELKAQQEAAARAERDKMAQEKAGQEAATLKQLAAAQEKQSGRKLVSGVIDEDVGRKKFLKGL